MTVEELNKLVVSLKPGEWYADRFKGEDAILRCGTRGMPDDLAFNAGAMHDDDPELAIQTRKVVLLGALSNLAPEILALVQDCHEARLFGDHHAMLDALDAFNTKLARL